MDVELVKIRKKGARPEATTEELEQTLNPPSQEPYKFPEPPRPK